MWNSTMLQWAVDDIVYETRVQGQHVGPLDGQELGFQVIIPQIPFYMILNTAVAYFWPPGEHALYPVYHVIDWVRMYE